MQQQHQETQEIAATEPVRVVSSLVDRKIMDTSEIEDAPGLDALEANAYDIARLRQKLPLRSVLRQVPFDSIADEPLSPEKLQLLLTVLSDPAPSKWRERMYSAALLGRAVLTEAQRQRAANVLNMLVSNRQAVHQKRFAAHMREAFRMVRPLTLIGVVIGGIWTLEAAYHTGGDVWFVTFANLHLLAIFLCIPIYFGLATVIGSSLAFLAAPNRNRERTAAALALARLQAPEGVGTLARAMYEVSPALRTVAEPGLRHALPALTEDHYGRLDSDTVPALCNLLKLKKDRLFAHHVHTERLVIEVLQALGKIGDGSAVKIVQTLSADGWTEPVREAASHVLPVLLERQRQENDHSILVRGSMEPSAPQEHLLRPLETNAPPTPPEHLLRPASE